MVSDLINSCVKFIHSVLFFKIFSVPAIVVLVVLSATYLMFSLRFIHIRSWIHTIKSLTSKNKHQKSGEVSGFSAFMSAAGSTLGMGNIIGGAIAVKIGGAGSLFWIATFAIFLSIIKFSEVVLAHKYRTEDKEKIISGGAFFYISKGFADLKFKKLGQIVAVFYSICFIMAFTSAGGFQLNQISSLITHEVFHAKSVIPCGVIVAFLSFLILMGGIHRVAKISVKLVPIMVITHIILSCIMLISYRGNLGGVFRLIIDQAFLVESEFGGIIFVIGYSLQRILFATDAGTGSAAIANSNSSSSSLKQGTLVSFESLLVAVMMIFSGLTVLVAVPNVHSLDQDGIHIVSLAFSKAGSFFLHLFFINLTIFGFTSIISNGYAVEKTYYFLTKGRQIALGRLIYCVFCGFCVILPFSSIMPLADTMFNLAIVVNVLSILFISGILKKYIKA